MAKSEYSDGWDLVIRPQRHLFDLKLKELWGFRDLLTMFVKRDIVTVYKQTVLGPIWYILQPILTMLVYIVVFGKIANISTDGVPQPMFYLTGIVMWNYFNESFTQTSDTFSANASLFGKVYFPRLIIPVSKIISSIIKFVIQFTLVILVLGYYIIVDATVKPNLYIFLLPVLLVLMACLGLGAGVIFSSLTTKYRDLKFLITFGVQLLMYATPVIYPMSTIDNETIRQVLWFNPLTHILEAFKFSLLGAGELSANGLIYSGVFAVLLLFAGIIIFNKAEQNFMDTV